MLNGVIHLPLILPPVVTGYILLLLFGRRAFVLDVKREYGPLCRAVGVQPISLVPGGGVRLNPLASRPEEHAQLEQGGVRGQRDESPGAPGQGAVERAPDVVLDLDRLRGPARVAQPQRELGRALADRAILVRSGTALGLRGALRGGFARRDGPTLIEVPVGPMPSPWEFIFLPKVRGK